MSEFLSTPSARRATPPEFNYGAVCVISIHALREEGDPLHWMHQHRGHEFLSTPSARRATLSAGRFVVLIPISIHALREEGDAKVTAAIKTTVISIHALREEGDPSILSACCQRYHFYPRPPRGGRLPRQSSVRQDMQNFYPRPPRGGRPAIVGVVGRGRFISIHALREEGDRPPDSCTAKCSYFYPRPPRGGRLPASPATTSHS